MTFVIKYLLARLKERSTIVTLVSVVVGYLGIKLSPDSANVITDVVIAILASIGIFTREVK